MSGFTNEQGRRQQQTCWKKRLPQFVRGTQLYLCLILTFGRVTWTAVNYFKSLWNFMKLNPSWTSVHKPWTVQNSCWIFLHGLVRVHTYSCLSVNQKKGELVKTIHSLPILDHRVEWRNIPSLILNSKSPQLMLGSSGLLANPEGKIGQCLSPPVCWFLH